MNEIRQLPPATPSAAWCRLENGENDALSGNCLRRSTPQQLMDSLIQKSGTMPADVSVPLEVEDTGGCSGWHTVNDDHRQPGISPHSDTGWELRAQAHGVPKATTWAPRVALR